MSIVSTGALGPEGAVPVSGAVLRTTFSFSVAQAFKNCLVVNTEWREKGKAFKEEERDDKRPLEWA